MNYFHKSKNTNKKQGGRNAESRPSNDHDAKPALKEKLVNLGRSSKSNKGGRRFSFNALVVVGNQKGSVGIGQGKAKEVPDAVQKATQRGGRQLHTICLSGTTIPHIVIGKASGSRVLLKPAAPGTGIKAGGAVRAVLENAGVQDILSKSLGSNNKGSLVKATLDALKQLRSREDMRLVRQ